MKVEKYLVSDNVHTEARTQRKKNKETNLKKKEEISPRLGLAPNRLKSLRATNQATVVHIVRHCSLTHFDGQRLMIG